MPKMSWNSMFNKQVQSSLLLCLLFTMLISYQALLSEGTQAFAQGEFSAVLPQAEDHLKVLVVYSTADGEMNEAVRLLDLLLGHFTTELRFVADDDLQESDLQKSSHLVYYGTVEKVLTQKSKRLMNQYTGSFLAVGHNVEQLNQRFTFFSIDQQVTIHKLTKHNTTAVLPLDYGYTIPKVHLQEGEVLVHGWLGENSFPLYMHDGESAYFAGAKLDAPLHNILGEGLYSFFGQAHTGQHLAYIRLEDVHPFSDPVLVRAAGEYLIEKQIPFMIAVIPIYTNPDTLQQYHLEDMPELVQVLRDLQDGGGSILLHGYTHQYRSSETGEGFEFWDVEHNRPISAPPDEDVLLRNRHDFHTKEEYQLYLEQIRRFDHQYTRARIEQGISELTELGLYPLGFEAPHYTMSQEGYRVVSEYFQYLLGQVQLGDRNWQHMVASPYLSTPSFLHGLTLLPETIGYYDPESKAPLDDLRQNVAQMRFIKDGVLGGFYHPYLGIENLQEFIELMETIPQLHWIDLKNMDRQVSEKFTALDRSELSTKQTLTRLLIELKNVGIVHTILWFIVILVTLAVTAFTLYTLQLRLSLRKRLFEERDMHG